MVSAPVCYLVGHGFGSQPGHPGGPLLSKSDEETQSGLCTLVHIQRGVTIKYWKSPLKISQKTKNKKNLS